MQLDIRASGAHKPKRLMHCVATNNMYDGGVFPYRVCSVLQRGVLRCGAAVWPARQLGGVQWNVVHVELL